MLNEYSDIIVKLKDENNHFASIIQKHEELDKRIDEVESGRDHMEQFELEKLKKEKLALKDEAYNMIISYKKEHNL